MFNELKIIKQVIQLKIFISKKLAKENMAAHIHTNEIFQMMRLTYETNENKVKLCVSLESTNV
jgi:hypothetical protein